MPESVSRAGGDQHESRVSAREESRGAAPIGAVVGGDECVGLRIRAGREQRLLSGGLEVPRQENRGPAGGTRAQREAAIVQRPAAVVGARVEDVELEARPDDTVASLQSQHGDPACHRVGHDGAGCRIALGSFAEPQLPDIEIAQHRPRAARVIVVIVREREHLEAAATPRRERGRDDAIAGVESTSPRGTGIHEDESAVGAAQDDR